jgi:hypothetical protein
MEYNFESKNFPSLLLREFSSLWTSIKLESLPSEEKDGLILLLTLLGVDWEQYDPVLLVKSEGGILTRLFGPAIFAGEENQLILKIGEWEIPCKEEKGKLLAGNLMGKVHLVPLENAQKEIYYQVFTSLFVIDSDPEEDDDAFLIPLITRKGISQEKLKTAVNKDKSIAEFLLPVPGKGESTNWGETFKMQELTPGEYEVASITGPLVSDKFPRPSYKLNLADGRSVWARGNSLITLESGWQKPPDQPLTLQISLIEEYSEGKYKVENALRLRHPAIAAQPHRAQLEAAKPDVIDVESLPVEAQGAIPF